MIDQSILKKAGKIVLLISSCSLFMGNKGCESDEFIRRGRILKKTTISMGIRSAQIELGDGINIDVEEIINGQYLTVLQDSQYFVSADGLGVQSLSSQERIQSKKSRRKFRPLVANKTFGSCTKDLPEAILAGNATDFELGNEFGLSLGLGGIFGGIITDAAFTLKTMKMGLDLHTYQPLSGTHMASTHKEGVKNDFGGGLGINLGIITINPTATFRKPVAEVVRGTLMSAVRSIGKELEAMESWSARVYKEDDSHIMINAGLRHGLKKGDTLYISNVKYFWNGEPCLSRLDKQLNLQDRNSAVAKVIITTKPSLDISVGRVFDQTGIDIQEGARVYIYALAGSKDSKTDPLPNAPNPEEWVPKK